MSEWLALAKTHPTPWLTLKYGITSERQITFRKIPVLKNSVEEFIRIFFNTGGKGLRIFATSEDRETLVRATNSGQKHGSVGKAQARHRRAENFSELDAVVNTHKQNKKNTRGE